ncbi:WbqC family protein [Phenylobacterium sp.]|uniref:WbqC family protein n=1 Tax=Phenylobacterium sp. TaxID=1871053 RepID=UPI002D0919D0|nr:WbqC family protein [Phenylobacterium sp.]HLZ75886.1 WbqC family protein [Phenylobacterium sp.]
MTAIAIMQPYFLPYAGYFRLIAQTDLFVIYDCVQFPRRGWLHRNKLTDAQGAEQWLTLPLKPAPQEVLIADLEFADNAADALAERLRPFPVASRDGPHAALLAQVRRVEGRPAGYIAGLLEAASRQLGLPWNVIRSSSLDVPQSLRGQDRILEIARRLGATRYVNAPGGRDLYEARAFADAGIELSFLEPWAGAGGSILQRLADDDPAALAQQVQHG